MDPNPSNAQVDVGNSKEVAAKAPLEATNSKAEATKTTATTNAAQKMMT